MPCVLIPTPLTRNLNFYINWINCFSNLLQHTECQKLKLISYFYFLVGEWGRGGGGRALAQNSGVRPHRVPFLFFLRAYKRRRGSKWSPSPQGWPWWAPSMGSGTLLIFIGVAPGPWIPCKCISAPAYPLHLAHHKDNCQPARSIITAWPTKL